VRLIVHYLAYREASGDAGRPLLRRPRQASAHGESRSRRGRASRSRRPADGGPAGVRVAKKAAVREAEAAAHGAVDEVKRALGERGPVWWDDGAPDFNRRVAKNTPYADGTRALLASATEDCELPKAAIFDLDGTLLDSVDLHAIAWQEDNTADRMAAVGGWCGEASPWREN
jgi:hypothetical protein